MQITPDLRLVLPVRRDENGATLIHGYHSPISREVFEANYRILSAAQAALFGKGLVFAARSGPRIAALRLLDEGRRDAAERGEFDDDGKPRDGGAGALLAELKRSTVVFVPGAQGWDQLPIDAAINARHIDIEDWREAESAIAFFTSGYAMAPRAGRQKMAEALAGVMGASITSSDAMAFGASLPRLNQAAPGAAKAASSVPS